jgi:hypothetical protein
MSVSTPYDRLVGTWRVYLAPAAEAAPTVSSTPSGNWAELGPTDEDQGIKHGGALTYFRDNTAQGPRKAVRPEEEVMVSMTVVGLTLENYAKILNAAANVVSAVGPPATKKIPVVRGFNPTEYALLLKGTSDSPYGNFPGQWYFPRVVVDGEPEQVRARDGSPGLEIEFGVLWYASASAGEEMGIWIVQTA